MVSLPQALPRADGSTLHGIDQAVDPAVLWTHVVSDGLTAFSYWAIALILVYLVYRANREHAEEAPGLKRLPYPWLFVAFGLFIMACGTVHLLLMWTVWAPVYTQLGLAKAFMAVASVGTAIALPPLVPRVLKLLREARMSEERQLQLAEAHDDLQEAHRRVKEYDELKSRFFANVSHELRTPLALILEPVSSILEEGVPREHRDRLSTVHRNANLLRRRVDDLLAVSRLDAGRLEPVLERTDLSKLVRRTAANFDGLAAKRGITLDVQAPSSLSVSIDLDQVQRVLLNLLGNAFQFAPDGGTVRVVLSGGGTEGYGSAPAAEEPSAPVLLQVRDDGPGVPPEERAAVFERFHQVEANAGRGGSGLGLAIAKEFVELHGGRIWLDEAPEGGARFTVELPANLAEEGTPDSPEEPGSREERDPSPDAAAFVEGVRTEAMQRGPADLPRQSSDAITARMRHVLVVEDNADMLRYLVESLGREYRISTARDGEEALRSIEAGMPDLVLTDVMMPGMRGDALVRAIRERDELRDVPIVVLTANADAEMRIDLLRDGAQDYLVKPFAMEEVRARVGNLLQLKNTLEILRGALRARTGDLDAVARRVVESREELRDAVAEAERARLEAETANRAKSEFLSIMSHELRTPLNAILGFNELLTAEIEGPLNEAQRAQSTRIRANARRLLGMIDQILELSRIEAGRDRVDLADADLSLLIADVAEHMRPMIERKGLRFLVNVPRGAVPIRTDAEKLRQIIENLVSNAVKFTVDGEIAVEADLEGADVLVRVRDTGMGIDEEDLERIFEPFWQVEQGRTRSAGGAGLGLTISRRFAQLLGGNLWIESEPGLGTLLTVRLPARLPDPAA